LPSKNWRVVSIKLRPPFWKAGCDEKPCCIRSATVSKFEKSGITVPAMCGTSSDAKPAQAVAQNRPWP
jgi:hypothetical protein